MKNHFCQAVMERTCKEAHPEFAADYPVKVHDEHALLDAR